jgi:hypothetical protein
MRARGGESGDGLKLSRCSLEILYLFSNLIARTIITDSQMENL